MKYRSDIDGLRAIAVLPVLLFHAGVTGVSGGYAGVDIFFVISGYLITTIILQEKTAENFSLLHFYERRARRILPLLMTVLIATLIFGMVVMTPPQMMDMAMSAIAALGFSSNMVFAMQDGYFNAASDLKPLLHTWSLAVEEQYYIIFPLVLMMLWRFPKSILFGLVFLGAVLSFILANWGGMVNVKTLSIDGGFTWMAVPDMAYYILPTRAWEILIGSIAAFILFYRSWPESKVLSLTGLMMIMASYFIFDKGTPYPSLYTLIPVLGCFLIIVFNDSQSMTHKILSWRPFVFTGLLSYGLYMWHFPVFAYAKIIMGEEGATPSVLTLLCLPILILTWITWKYIETPFRKRAFVTNKKLMMFLCGGVCAITVLASLILLNKGFIHRYSDFEKQFLVSFDERGDYVAKEFNSHLNKQFPDNGKKNILVIGDSHAQDFMNIIHEGDYYHDWNISTFTINTECQLYLGDRDVVQSFIKQNERRTCDNQIENFIQSIPIKIGKADKVYIIFSWRKWAVERLGETMAILNGYDPDNKITYVGLKTFVKPDLAIHTSPDFKFSWYEECEATNAMLESRIKDKNFINMKKILCDGSNQCPMFTEQGRLISYDGGHLTQDGATFMADKLRNILEKDK